MQANSWILLPIKDWTRAKSRLDPAVTAADRRALAEAMARDAIETAMAVPGVAGVAVLTDNQRIAAAAAFAECHVYFDDPELGFSGNIDRVIRALQALGAERVLVLGADLPMVRAADIEAVFARGVELGGVCIGRAARDDGTTALLIPTQAGFITHFGAPGSATLHAGEASACGLLHEFLGAPFDRDVDTLEDLEKIEASACGGHVIDLLEVWRDRAEL